MTDNHVGKLKVIGSALVRKTWRDPISFWTALSSTAACFAALFAGWAAFETRQGELEAGRATRASVWLQLLNEYEAPEMLSSMKELRSWQQQRPKDFASEFEKLLLKPNKTPDEQHVVDALDLDRRRVAGFFSTLQILCEGRIIDESFAKESFGGSTYRFLIDVEVPMQRAKADALVQTNSMTKQDEADAEKRNVEVTEFYKRVLH